MEKLSLIVCTKDRPKEIECLFESLIRQSILPFEVIVVDGGTHRVETVVNRYSSKLRIHYHTLLPPSLTRQRNLGIQKLDPAATLVGFIDDDLEFETGALDSMIRFFDAFPTDVGGASFNIVNYEVSKIPKLKSLFLLDAGERGKLLKSGVGTAYFPAEATGEVKWLCGGATVWRRKVVSEQRFDEFFYNLGWNEDIDFSFRASQKFRLYVVHNARVLHHESQTSRIDNFKFGQIQSVHRLYVVKKYKEHFSILACYWACVGQMLVNLMKGLTTLNGGLSLRAVGNGFGIIKVLFGFVYVVKRK